jgi:hypothetical protein
MTNDTYDARAAGRFNSAVSTESPQRRISGIIPSHRPLSAFIHWSPPVIENYLECKLAQITNNDMFIFGRYHNLQEEVFKDFESDIAVKIWTLGDLTQETAESNDTVKQSTGSEILTRQLQLKKSNL